MVGASMFVADQFLRDLKLDPDTAVQPDALKILTAANSISRGGEEKSGLREIMDPRCISARSGGCLIRADINDKETSLEAPRYRNHVDSVVDTPG